MFKFKMTDELTMAKADEDAQRVYAKKLAADRESQKRKRAEEQKGNRLEADRERKNRKRAEELPEEKAGLRLIEKERTESVPRNYQSNAKADLLLKEKVKKKACRGITKTARNQACC